jgi:hypothetical protein
MVPWTTEVTLRLLVPDGRVGGLIGKQGEVGAAGVSTQYAFILLKLEHSSGCAESTNNTCVFVVHSMQCARLLVQF